jgi:hypothetical protein
MNVIEWADFHEMTFLVIRRLCGLQEQSLIEISDLRTILVTKRSAFSSAEHPLSVTAVSLNLQQQRLSVLKKCIVCDIALSLAFIFIHFREKSIVIS